MVSSGWLFTTNNERPITNDDWRKFEFLMVKLLRVYGECLGSKSR